MTEFYIAFIALLLIGLFIAGSSYSRLIRIYNKYNTYAYANITAAQFLAGAFRYLNLPHYRITINEKPFSDAYLIKKKIVVLSAQNVNSKTISAITVAAHEVGHIMQEKNGSKLFAISYLLQILGRIADILLFPSLIVGGILILFSSQYIMLGNIILFFGISLYMITLFLKIVTIPLELDASKRALSLLKTEHIFDEDELIGAKKLLRAAALTYVGSLFYNLYRFLRGISRSFN